MIDLKLLRDDAQELEKKLQSKDPSIQLQSLVVLDQSIRELKTKVEALKSERNTLSKKIGELKREKIDTSEHFKKVGDIAHRIEALDTELSKKEAEFNHQVAFLPNVPSEDVKVALDPKQNVCEKEWGKKTHFTFDFKNHLELNELHHFFDFEKGAKVTGSGWPTYKGMGARLEMALIQFFLAYHIQNGFTQWIPPLLVKEEMMYAAGQFPKFKDQAYQIDDKQFNYCLLPTAEVALNALHTDEILNEEELPLKYVSYTPCFRREAGAAGKQERGLIRTHQFNKVEMFAFTKPDRSEYMLKQFIEHAEDLLEKLELPYKRMLLVTGDMSFSAAKTYDIEVFLPGQDRYMEVSSISNCTDFQARRSKIRFKEKGGKPQLVHTLNGSGLATSRVMVALLENHQCADGSIKIPKALRPYLGGKEKLLPRG